MADFTDIIKTVAPWIGTALGGPLGGMALTAAANALGLPAATTDSLKQAISGATPDQMLALKQADNNFALQMKTLDIQSVDQLAALQVENTKDARAMQVSTRSWVPGVLACTVTVGFFGILFGMMTGKLSTDGNQALYIMLGALGAAWGAIINYFFGSSAGSARKDELAAGAQPEAATIKPTKL
jgi:hypothetical protein